MVPKVWWHTLIFAMVLSVGTYILVVPEISNIQEMNNIRENGYYYQGEQVLTLEQYNIVKDYNNFHGGTIEITNPAPLTVKYYFACLDKYDYLTQIEQPATDKLMGGSTPVFYFMVLTIPMLALILAGVQFFNREKEG